MMKKLLSIILTVCMLLSLVIVPVAVQADDSVVTYDETTLGGYYKFTFGEDGDQYNYVVSSNSASDTNGQASYKGNTFYPLWVESGNAANGGVEYKTVTFADGVEKDVVELSGAAGINFTPLTKEGKPFEIKPGVEYKIIIEGYNPICNCWAQSAIAFGGSNNKAIKDVIGRRFDSDGSVLTAEYQAKSNRAYGYVGGGAVGGQSFALYLKEGTYYSDYKTFAVASMNPQFDEAGIATSRTVGGGWYMNNTLSLDESFAEYDAVNNSYSTKLRVKDTEDQYVYNNNYLTLSLGGGDALNYKASATYPLFSTATKEELDELSKAPAVWQIESITIYETNYAGAVLHVGDTATEIKGEAGANIPFYAPAAPAGKVFVNWYNDAAFTSPVTAAQVYEIGNQKHYYARFEDYDRNLKEGFDSGIGAVASQYFNNGTVEGFYLPTIGYNNKTGYSTTVDAGKTPAWTKTELVENLKRVYGDDYDTTYPSGVFTAYSDRTWGMPGIVGFKNADGTAFRAKPGATYKVTIKHRLLLKGNGTGVTVYLAYGIGNTFVNKTSTTDKSVGSARNVYFTTTTQTTEWTEETLEITIPTSISSSYVPYLYLIAGGVDKKAVDTDADGVADTYDYTVIQFDSVDIEKIPSATVNFLNADGSVHTAAKELVVGDAISYPTLTAAINYDYVWSLSATSYVPAPKTVENEEDLTVYAYQNPVLSYENRPVHKGNAVELYPGNIDYDNEMSAVASDKDAYTGDKSLRLRNYGMAWVATEANYNTAVSSGAYKYDAETDTFVKLDTVPEFVAATEETIANGTAFAYKRVAVETGMNVIEVFPKCESISLSYKISFKYKATEKNTTESTFSARLFPKGNIWWGSQAINGTFTFPAGATDGWQTGEMYVSVDNFTNVPGKTFYTSGNEFVLDLKFNGHETLLSTNEIYVDDIVIEKNYVNTPTLYVHTGDTVTEITEGLTVGGAVDLSTIDTKAPADKFFTGWVDANGNAVASLTMPGAGYICKAHIYATYSSYPDNASYVTAGDIALKGYSAFTSSVLNESGWALKFITDSGIRFEKAYGGASKWNPALDGTSNGHGQTTSRSDLIAVANDQPVGTQIAAGWVAYQNYIVRDADGNAVILKPNTKYAVVVTYEKVANGAQGIQVGVGRRADMVTTGANDKYASAYNRFVSSELRLDSEPITGKNAVNTFYVDTKNYTAGDVPVLSVHYAGYSFVGERVEEDANGVKSYTLANGTTYYPYKIASAPAVTIKSVQLIEVDSGNTAVTYVTYDANKNEVATLTDAAPGTALNADTNNFDTKWYSNKGAIGSSVVTTYPAANATYYSAAFMQNNPDHGYTFGMGNKHGVAERNLFDFENVEIDGKDALHIGIDQELNTMDAECFVIAPQVTDGHTYKVTFKYKVPENNPLFGFYFTIAQSDNWWSRPASFEMGKILVNANVSNGEWTEVTGYFTVDLTGTVQDASETGVDYIVNNDYRTTLFATAVLGNPGEWIDVYYADFEIVDLGAVISAGGASVLTDAAAQIAGSQAMRYYYSYNTVDGSTIALGDDTLKVVERGFIYRNGALENGKVEAEFRVGSTGTVKQSKTSDFNICWNFDQATGNMTFSTYVTGFKMDDDARKLQVRAYIIVEDANGMQSIIYSDAINRTVAGVKGLGGASDTDVEAGQ